MKKQMLIGISFLLLGAGCNAAPPADMEPDVTELTSEDEQLVTESPIVSMPLDGGLLTYKRFGEFFQDRFFGYHLGEDYEVGADTPDPVPVYAIADGVVSRVSEADGYGGYVMIVHTINGEVYTALYGHLNTEFMVSMGEEVRRGEQIGILGADKSEHTDGERRHLHFSMQAGKSDDINGYARTSAAVENWINPRDFLAYFGDGHVEHSHTYSELIDPQGKDIFGDLDFAIPAGWDVEYIPSIEALNLFETSGDGIARERSQILIRYFDADFFSTLSTVNIFETTDLTVGQGDYKARRYDIEKKTTAADFPAQPSWRNERHIVTDFRLKDGITRYYVVASAPFLDPAVYEEVLASMVILQ